MFKFRNGTIRDVGFVLLVFLQLYAQTVTAAGPMCLSCNDVVSPRTCTTVKQCGHYEKCYIESFVNEIGSLRYKLGCRDSNMCPTIRPQTRHTVRAGFLICLECCDGMMCNHEGCRFKGPPREQRGPDCFACQYQKDIGTCGMVHQCGRDEVCILKEELDTSGQLLYHSGCEEKDLCLREYNLINLYSGGKRSIDNAVQIGTECKIKCCDADYCNRNCELTNNEPSTALLTTTLKLQETTARRPTTRMPIPTTSKPSTTTHSTTSTTMPTTTTSTRTATPTTSTSTTTTPTTHTTTTHKPTTTTPTTHTTTTHKPTTTTTPMPTTSIPPTTPITTTPTTTIPSTTTPIITTPTTSMPTTTTTNTPTTTSITTTPSTTPITTTPTIPTTTTPTMPTTTTTTTPTTTPITTPITTTPSTTPTPITITPIASTVHHSNCKERWTPYFNTRGPYGAGDREVISDINRKLFCRHGVLTSVDCVTKNDLPTSTTGEKVHCDLENGLRCDNAENYPKPCSDYKIRYLCTCLDK